MGKNKYKNKRERPVKKCSVTRQEEAQEALEEYYRDNNKVKLKGKDIIFQAVDWSDEDLSAGYEDNDGFEKLKYVLQAFGVTADGHSVCATINGFCPYFFVKVPGNWKKTQLEVFANWLKQKREWNFRLKQQGRKLGESITNYSIVKRKDFYGFHNDNLFTFFRFDFDNVTAMKTAIRLFVTGEKVLIVDPKKKKADSSVKKRGTEDDSAPGGNIANEVLDLMEDMQDEKEEFPELEEGEGKKKKKVDRSKVSVEDEDIQYEYRSYYKEVSIPGLKRDHIYTLYESNLQPILRFMHLKDLLPAGWMKIPYKKYKKNSVSYCNIDVKCKWEDIVSAEDIFVDPAVPEELASLREGSGEDDSDRDEEEVAERIAELEASNKYGNIIPPIRQASFDIECYSDTGAFPQPENDNHCIFQIATAFKAYGSDNFFLKHIITLKESKKMIKSSNLCYDVKVDTDRAVEMYCELEALKDEADRDKKSDNVDPVDRWVEEYLKEYKKKSGFHVSRIKGKGSKFQLILRCFEYNIGPPPDIEIIGGAFEKYLAGESIIELLSKSSDSVPVIIECYDTETEVLMAWQRLIKRMDPDILYTYNGDKFDCNYLYVRAQKCGIDEKFCDLSRLRDYVCTITEATFESGAYGTNHYKRLLMPGRINFDLLIYVQREQKLELYKLDYVAEKFLKDNKDPVSAKDMFRLFAKGGEDDIKIVAEYCIQDTDLPQRLIDKLDVLPIYIEMGKVTCVPMSYLLYKGQQIKVFSQILRKTSKENYLVPHRRAWKWDKKLKEIVPTNQTGKYKGATVLNAVSGAYYEPVTTLDFASLYPTAMMANILCYTTFVEENGGLYDNIPGQEYFDVAWEEDEETYNENGDSFTPPHYTGEKVKFHYRFAQKDNSILPVLLAELYKTRKMVKKLMASEPDPFKKSVLNGRQLAIKVSMNSVYGFLAAQMLCCKPIAATVTTVGRKMIEETQKFSENDFPEYVKNYMVSEIDTERCSIAIRNPKTGEEERDIFVERCVINDFEVGKYMVEPATPGKEIEMSCQAIYGDSVVEDTPLLLKDPETGLVHIRTIDSLSRWDSWIDYSGFKDGQTGLSEKQQSSTKFQVWTNTGWANIKRVIRHKTNKKIYRVTTWSGCVDVTEDHSLLDLSGNKIKPKDCKVGSELLHSFPTEFPNFTIDELHALNLPSEPELGEVPLSILNSCEAVRREYYNRNFFRSVRNGRWTCKTKKTAMTWYFLLRSLGYNSLVRSVKLRLTRKYYEDGYELYVINRPELPNKISSIKELPTTDRFVYDLETETGKFGAGVGNMVVSNTDSVFLSFKTGTVGKKAQMVEAFKLGMVAGRLITRKLFKDPIDLEFEKVYYPLILIGKKMYIGALHEKAPDKLAYIDTKGVALKRRNYCHWVKDVCREVVDLLMDPSLEKYDKGIVENAEKTVRGHLEELIEGEVNLAKLTMTASLRDKYKSENVPHYRLQQKMAQRERDGLSDLPTPKSGDRIPFVYIESNKSKLSSVNEKAKKYEKIEHPIWAADHKLIIDVLFYIESQLRKPISQIFTPLVDDPEAILNHYIVKAQNRTRGYGDISKFINSDALKNRDLKLKEKKKRTKTGVSRTMDKWMTVKKVKKELD